MGELLGQNDVVLEGSQVTSSPYDCLSTVECEVWDRAEAAAEEVIRKVQPSVLSEERRRDVIDYLKSLLKGYLGCEVLPFGSVPLKAYLPDGDIDLTVFCGFNFEEAFAEEVYAVLKAEERNPAAKFVVKDVQYIRAEVKLVKCLVENVVVDVSFNQIGGLCTLCFLEEMDRLIGKDHLFKRSIILIKAWCYYESRILGAHHGLISTYALETLILYIFHVFHSSLDGPLAVLHKFLEYFSEFNWDTFCVSLSGPVHGASPPEALADKPETSGRELLLSDDFMKECVRKFSVPFRGADTNYKSFTQKYLNIVDPLKENNNLGRSVSKGNFFRIRTAFLFGAEKLGQILLQPQEKIAVEVRKFFTNTLDRHGKGNRPDVQKHLQLSSSNGYISETPPPLAEPYQDQLCTREEDSIYSNNKSTESRVGFEGLNHGMKNSSSQTLSGITLCKELSKDTNELETSGNRDLRTTEQGDKCCPSIGEKEKLRYAPHLFFQHSLEKGKMENECLDEEQDIDSTLLDNNLVCAPTHQEINGFLCHDSLSRVRERRDAVNQLPDLSGDLGCHLDNLQHGRWWYSHGLAMPMHPMHRVPLSMFIPNVSWDGMHPTVLSRQEMVPQVNVNGVILRPPFFPPNPPAASLGLGAHFTIENDLSFRDRSASKRRNRGQLKSSCVNGRSRTPLDRSSQAQVPFHQNIGRPIFPNNHERSPRGKVYRGTNGFLQPHTNVIAYCDPMNTPTETENFKPRESDPSSESQNIERVFGVNDNNSRYSMQPYQVKNEDFHRLCV